MVATKKGKDVFSVLADFFEQNKLDWKMLVGCLTDKTPAMLGGKSRFQAYVKYVSSKASL